MNVNDLAQKLGDLCYVFLALNFFWGLYCVVIGFRRVNQLSFSRREHQEQYLDELLGHMHQNNYPAAAEQVADDVRALPQLTQVAVANHKLGFEPMRQLVLELWQRDIMGDLEYRTSWLATVIKSGPLLGLFGTVLGMMAAFGRIGSGEKVQPTQIADEISIALICTAMGLATAIPFNFLLASINVRVRRLQESLTSGMSRVLDHFKRREQAATTQFEERRIARSPAHV